MSALRTLTQLTMGDDLRLGVFVDLRITYICTFSRSKWGGNVHIGCPNQTRKNLAILECEIKNEYNILLDIPFLSSSSRAMEMESLRSRKQD